MSRMRRAIARNLAASKQTIPHFYMKATIDAGPLLAFQKAEKEHYKCSVNDVITLAVARLLMEFPAFRGQIAGEEVVTYPDADIGVAVGVEEGLLVPVLKAADTRNLKGIAAESRRLVEAARAGKVEGMGEGVFTISNLGMFGIEEFSAIINPPESAILAVGAAREEEIVHNGAFRAGRRMTLTLSADHRIIDGVLAARFMARLRELLEAPEKI
jgi:pyruvate dehydrogenase E2 component (dihydrolipoamide acetyltransferase)